MNSVCVPIVTVLTRSRTSLNYLEDWNSYAKDVLNTKRGVFTCFFDVCSKCFIIKITEQNAHQVHSERRVFTWML